MVVRASPTVPNATRLPGGASGGTALSPQARLNRLAVAVRRYAHAHEGMLPPMRNQVALLEAVEPYLTARDSYQSPAMGPPFLPVAELAGKPLASLQDAQRRVMLYRARPEPDGHRLVAFLDCHVQAVTSKEWQQLALEQHLPAQ